MTREARVEKVARAIVTALDDDPDRIVPGYDPQTDMETSERMTLWEKQAPLVRRHIVHCADLPT